MTGIHDGTTCGVYDPKGRHACELKQGHDDMHRADGFMWKAPPGRKRASSPAKPAPKKTPPTQRNEKLPTEWSAEAKPMCGSTHADAPGRCLLFPKHAGPHFTTLEMRAYSWRDAGDEMNEWGICGARWATQNGDKGPTKRKPDKQHVCQRPDEHDGPHRGLDVEIGGNHMAEWEGEGPSGAYHPKTQIDFVASVLSEDVARFEPGPCGETLAGHTCFENAGHPGDHVADRAEWSHDRKSARFDVAPDRDERESDPAIEVPDVVIVEDDPPTATVTIVLPGKYKVHPAAAVLPLIEGAAFDAFVEDIRANGLRKKPVLDHTGEWLVDGRNRIRALEKLGRKIEFDHLPEGASVETYVISENLTGRRHMEEAARAMCASEIANLSQGQKKTRPGAGLDKGITQAEAAAAAGVGLRTVQRANAVRDKAVPELVAAVKQGKVDLKGAESVSKLSPAQQRAIVKERIEPSKTQVRAGKLASLSRQEAKRETIRKINTGKVPPMPIGQFGVIYVDYPWFYENSDQHEGSRGHMGYPGMKMPEILAHAREASKRMGRDCILALWVTNLYIREVGAVVDAYGAEAHTMLTWPKPRAGLGGWPRGQTEHLVIASVGNPVHTLNDISTLLPSYKLREHSRKPAEVAELLQKHCAGPFLELFAQEEHRDGWTLWGAEVGKFDATEAA